MTARTVDVGFHDGERAVQDRAGVRAEAARLEGMLTPASLSGGMARFLAAQGFAVLVGRDDGGRLWASPLTGQPGFLSGRDDVLDVAAIPDDGDPLRGLHAGQPAALIAPDLGRRRRVRVNGLLSTSDDAGLTVEVVEAFGNCPSYITQRAVAADPPGARGTLRSALDDAGELSPEAALVVGSADTFFLGTQHPQRGADASHKGGDPGFVRIEGADLVWTDYAGNNMFNSLGNLTVDPDAALLFVDFDNGTVVQLSGTATVDWEGTSRQVRFRPAQGVVRRSTIRGREPQHRPGGSSR